MIIKGLMKLTTLDFPGKVACTVFTGGCNFRCPFCHNASLVNNLPQDIPVSEITEFLKKRRGLLDGVCISGGEPLLQPDIADFLKSVKALGYAVKLDTNGAFPEKLKSLVAQGLCDYVAMDIKNSPSLYGVTAGIAELDLAKIIESKDFLLSGAVEHEFRTTVVAVYHTVESIRQAAAFIAGADNYFLQAFKDSGDTIIEGLSGVDKATMEDMKNAALAYVKHCYLRGI